MSRATTWLGGCVALGFGWILLFEPDRPAPTSGAGGPERVVGLPGSEVRRFRLERDQWTSATVERVDDTSFRAVDPSDRILPEPTVLAFLSAIEFATVKNHLVGSDADAAHVHQYGLDRPALTLTLIDARGDERRVVFGRVTPAGDGVYAAVRGRDGVVVADGSLSSSAQELLDVIVGSDPAGEGESEP